MPILNYTDRRTPKGRLVVAAIYLLLILGGLTMVYPFMVMLTGSLSNPYDYDRRSALPRYLWSREDRFMRTLCSYFPPSHRASIRQMRSYFSDVPEGWDLWTAIGDDTKNSDAWASKQLARLRDPEQRKRIDAAAGDYAAFMRNWDLRETVLAYDSRYVGPFLRDRYKTLARMNQAWQMAVDDFSQVSASEWSGEPIDQPGYVPIVDTRYTDLLKFRQAYRENRYSRFLASKDAYAGYLRPASLRYVWEDYYSTATGVTAEKALKALPFPVPANAPAAMRAQWYAFLKNDFPLRHIAIQVDAGKRKAFRSFLTTRFHNLDYLNRLLSGAGQTWKPVRSWDAIQLTTTAPDGPLAKVWMDFIQVAVPVAQWQIRDTLPDQAFQKFVLQRYKTLDAVNAAYGTHLSCIQQLGIPFGDAVLATFANREMAITLDQITANYRTVFDYLFERGRAVSNTVILVLLSLLVALTVNPLAGYALSRFRMRSTEKVIIFCLATMAFPAAVAAIPGFLLLRDLGLLNTFAALVLPGAANGMTIFLLKGFFDSLPKELYEAASIDGAPEWDVFWKISLPLVKPILAVSMLNAFIAAYNGWEWAIIVCQDKKMWTIAVWTYQFYQTLSSTPFVVMAAFIVNSIPVLLVFLFCQKIILRGIILPQMK